jgi:hypothetical protein
MDVFRNSTTPFTHHSGCPRDSFKTNNTRARTLSDLATLPKTQQASLIEVRELIEREHLYGLGCGLVDLTLLASTLLTPGSRLWTRDKRLAQLTERFGIAYAPAQH